MKNLPTKDWKTGDPAEVEQSRARHRVAIEAALSSRPVKRRMSDGIFLKWFDESYREAQSTSLRAAWADPDLRAKRVAAIRAGIARRQAECAASGREYRREAVRHLKKPPSASPKREV